MHLRNTFPGKKSGWEARQFILAKTVSYFTQLAAMRVRALLLARKLTRAAAAPADVALPLGLLTFILPRQSVGCYARGFPKPYVSIPRIAER